MFQDELLFKFSAAFPIPIQMYQDSTLLQTYCTQIFSPNPAYHLMYPYIHQGYSVCFVVSPDYLLCGYIELEGTDKYLIIGPVSPYEYSSHQAENILADVGLPHSRLDEMLRWFHYLPKISLPHFRNLLDFLNQLCNPQNPNAPIHVTYQVIQLEMRNSDQNLSDIHINRMVEQTLYKLVEYGKTEEAAVYFDSLFNRPDVAIADLASNAIRSLKNTFIASTSITTRAAINGGLDYDTAIALSDYYIAEMEKLQLFSDINAILRSMLLDFTKRVSLCRHPSSDSATVNLIYRDVQKHLHEKISSKDIAGHLSLERTYLCHHFKEKTGMTLTAYIQEQKIKEACYLLEATDLPLIMISEKLGFSSQQQFQSIFKKVTNMTPGKYRLFPTSKLSSEH